MYIIFGIFAKRIFAKFVKIYRKTLALRQNEC